MRNILVAVALLFTATLAWVLIAGRFDRGLPVTRDQFGPAWPLTVSEGTLRCESWAEITLQHGGTTYRLDGGLDHGAYSDISPLRAEDGAGGKKDLAPLIERGSRLCR
ncbi:MAG: DUF2511 domain-containing protein [Acidimicrobiales bacterium]